MTSILSLVLEMKDAIFSAATTDNPVPEDLSLLLHSVPSKPEYTRQTLEGLLYKYRCGNEIERSARTSGTTNENDMLLKRDANGKLETQTDILEVVLTVATHGIGTMEAWVCILL